LIELQDLLRKNPQAMERMYRIIWGWEDEQSPYHIGRMREDLNKFVKEIG